MGRVAGRMAKRWAVAASLAWLAAAGSGCVMVPWGKGETVTQKATTNGPGWDYSIVESVEPWAHIDDYTGTLHAGMRTSYKHTYCQTWRRGDKITVTKRKRLAIGLFPGAGELVWRPAGTPLLLGKYAGYEFLFTVTSGGLIPAFTTVKSFFGKGKWECDNPWKAVDDAVAWERWFIAHSQLIGFHQNVLEVPIGYKSVTNSYNNTAEVRGDYEVELRIPEIGFSQTASVGGDWWQRIGNKSEVTFALPQARRGGEYDATLTFRSKYVGTGDPCYPIWTTKTLTRKVELEEKPLAAASGFALQAVEALPLQQPLREVVKEVHHYHETRVEVEKKPKGAPWNIETVEEFRDGQAEYLVTRRDPSIDMFEMERKVQPDIERNLREAFMASMPGMDEGNVVAYAVAKYEEQAIRFRGVAFSAVPKPGCFHYDPDTGRGSLELTMLGGMDIQDMERWARKNIDDIVANQNVTLEAGKASPAGAKYRFLNKNFDPKTGVLTVEFEAVE